MGVQDLLILLQDPFLHILVMLIEFSLQAENLQVGFHPSQKFFGLEGTGDIVHPADGKGPDLVEGLIVAADEQNGDIGELGVFFQLGAGLKTIHVRHGHVHQDQVGEGGSGRIGGRGARCGLDGPRNLAA